MGSSGSGRISDYPGTSRSTSKSESQKKVSGENEGRGTEIQIDDRCARPFSVRLEDVEHSDHFATYSSPPSVGTVLHIQQRKRLIGETSAGQSVGNLPTSYNYLASCLKDGWIYTGTVSMSTTSAPVIVVRVDFTVTRST